MGASTDVWFVIINPTSGNGRAKKKWPTIKRLLVQHGFQFKYAFTEYPGHTQLLVNQYIKHNFSRFISVGGDGTLHGIVNGIMTQTDVPFANIKVGVIPIGTGNDWVKTHQIPRDIKRAIQLIKKEQCSQQDIGKIEFLNSELPPVYFNNLAGIGFDAYVVSKVSKHKNLGAIAYLLAALIGLFSFKNFNSRVIINSEEISGKTLMILIGLCKYSGGGMQLTQQPNPFDGLFDVSIVENLSKFEILKHLPKLFNGKIHTIKRVQHLKTTSLKIYVEPDACLLVEADGELIGTGAIEVSLIPKALSFYC